MLKYLGLLFLGLCCSVSVLQGQTPVLLTPADGDTVASPYPMFSWFCGALPNGASFHFRLVELLPHQSPTTALLSNPVIHQRTGLYTYTYLYPLDAPTLTAGQAYAWQVILVDPNPDAPKTEYSPPFAFYRPESPASLNDGDAPVTQPKNKEKKKKEVEKKKKKKKKPEAEHYVYAHLHNQMLSVVHLITGDTLAFQYQREYVLPQGGRLSPRIYTASMRPVPGGPWLTAPRFLSKGDNRFVLDVGDLERGRLYVLEVRSAKGDRWFLKFKKVESSNAL